MNDEQRKAAVAIFGEEFTSQLISQGMQKTAELEAAGVASKQVATEPEAAPAPEPVPAEVPATDSAQLVQELAATMQANLNEAIAPVFSNFQEQLATLGEQVKALSDELKQVKGEQAIKQQVELPRFTFDMIRASQANQTAVPEGDALKDKKPQEASVGGSLTAAYWPNRK